MRSAIASPILLKTCLLSAQLMKNWFWKKPKHNGKYLFLCFVDFLCKVENTTECSLLALSRSGLTQLQQAAVLTDEKNVFWSLVWWSDRTKNELLGHKNKKDVWRSHQSGMMVLALCCGTKWGGLFIFSSAAGWLKLGHCWVQQNHNPQHQN